MHEVAILVVEDDEDFRTLMVEALESSGFSVRAARDGREALALLRAPGSSRYLVLLDLMMPGMNGWEFVAAMRGDPRLRGNPIVVATVMPEDAPRAVDAILQKPFDLETLERVIVQHSSRAGLPAQAASQPSPLA